MDDYTRFICGYHIRTDQKADHYAADPDQYCALDWYSQSAQQRRWKPAVWDHFLILDTVDPFKWYEASAFKTCGQYTGWDAFEVGAEGW